MTATTQLRAALADRYRIEREIGAGGMATVYLARDLRHERNVALKVLKPDLGAVVGSERFLAEIRVTANLQHPNLLPLFDSGEADGLLFYVMPYVDGETLRTRIAQEKQLPVDEAVHIATAVAGALHYAHAHGVIHRDLKPENILMQAGQPVIADFGIALALSNAGGSRITQTGLSLGTPQYMSPEQATGDRSIDGRTDIYSLAAVLYEMLTGDPPHTASTAQGIIAKVLTDRPRPVRASRPAVPSHVEGAIEHALEKLPADRFATAQQFADALTGKATYARPASSPAAEPLRAPGLVSRMTVGALAAAVVILAGLLIVSWWREPSGGGTGRYMVAQLLPPPGYRFEDGANFALSPDGSRLAFVANKGRGIAQALWVRSLDTLGAVQMMGTENALEPFWSPDGKRIGFFADGQLKVIPAAGGSVKTLCPAPTPRAGSWGADDRIVFSWGSGASGSALTHFGRTSASGGGCGPIALPDSFGVPSRPIFLPDGRHVIGVGRSALLVVDAQSVRATRLPFEGSNAQFVAPDWIVFNNTTYLEARRFDPKRFVLSGQPTRLLDQVTTPLSFASFAVSQTGTLVAASPTGEHDRILWYDRTRGLVVDSTMNPFRQPRNTWTVQLSHDGTRTAMGGFRLAVYDLVRNTSVDLNTGTRAQRGSFTDPAWSPLDSAIAYVTANRNLCVFHIATSRVDTVFASKDRGVQPTSWTPDGRSIVFTLQSGDTTINDGVWTYSAADRSVHPLVVTSAATRDAHVSPDGKWLVYQSNETGSFEIYVRPLSGGVPPLRLSTDGGRLPTWERSGEAVLYVAGDGRVMSAGFQFASGLKATQAHTVLQPSQAGLSATALLVPRDPQGIGLDVGATSSTLTIITNWPAKIARSPRPPD